MNDTNKSLINEAGAWHHFMVQELGKKQNGENYHWALVAAGLRHVQRYCSDEAFRYYLDLYNGQRQVST